MYIYEVDYIVTRRGADEELSREQDAFGDLLLLDCEEGYGQGADTIGPGCLREACW